MTDNIKNLYDEYQKDLNNWLNSININIKDTHSSDIEDFFSMTYDDISTLDIDTLNKYIFIIYKHLTFIQNKINECKTFVNWCKQIKYKVGSKNEISTLDKWHNIATNRIIRMEYITRRIEMICKPIENLIFVKRRL